MTHRNDSATTPRIVVAHSGKQHAYRHAAAVQRLRHLERFITSAYYKPDCFPDRLAARFRRLDAALRRRCSDEIDSQRVIRRWRYELPELLVRTVIGNGRCTEALVNHRDARFDRWVAREWATRGDIYWGFQGSCLESLRAARSAGVIAVAEFATAHVTLAQQVLQAEAERHPEWADTISNFRFPQWYRERLEQEPQEADYCVAASSFTKRSLLAVGVEEQRVKLLPLGADVRQFAEAERSPDGPFRILFVGGIGQRKGLKYLLEAVRRLHATSIDLVLVGPKLGPCRALEAYQGLFTWKGRLDQPGVVHEMHLAHVLVLPSVFEGFGLVIPEAMATGLPVITSTRSIGPEIITDGIEGFVLEPDDIDGLATKLDWMASHRRQSCEMGRAAARRAREFSWQAHQRRLAAIIAEIWNESHAATGEKLSPTERNAIQEMLPL